LSFQVHVAAPLGAVSKFPLGFGLAGPSPGIAHGSIGDALKNVMLAHIINVLFIIIL
jgi:hypothetical protein